MRFLPALERKSTPVERATSRGWGLWKYPYQSTWSVDRAVTEAYERVIWVFRAVDAVASNGARVPIVLREGGEDGPEVLGDPLLRLLNRWAHPWETAFQFRYRLLSVLQLSKKGVFVEVIYDRLGRPVNLYLMAPGDTTPVPDPRTFVSKFSVTLNGQPEEVPAYYPDGRPRVLWIRKPHPTDPYSGVTPLESAGLSVDMDWFARLYNRSFLANDGRPGGILAVKGEMEEDDKETLKQRHQGGPSQAGKFSVINAEDMTWIDTAVTPRDAQFAQILSLTKSDILDAFGVPESILANSSERTFCADTETEILTRRGWLRYDQVQVGDVAMTVNPASGLSEWQPVDAVNVFDGPHEVVKLRNPRHSSVTTLGHRWWTTPTPSAGNNWRTMPRWRWRTSGELCQIDRIPAAVPPGDAPEQAKWSDDLVELVAWFYTEGWIGPHRNVVLTQSEAVNPQHAARIRALLGRMFGPPREERGYGGWIERAGRQDAERGITRFHISPLLVDDLHAAAPDKVPTMDFLCSLTPAQLELFIAVSAEADGTYVSHRSSSTGQETPWRTLVFVQTDRRRTEAFHLACVLAGKSAQLRQNGAGSWSVCVQRNPWRTPGMARYRSRGVAWTVWCPTTANGTWFARRDGTTYFTGNSNAAQEKINFWEETMPPPLDLIAGEFDKITRGGMEDEVYVTHDLDAVPTIQRAKRERETHLLALWEKGVISTDEFRKATGRDPYDVVETRALYMASSKKPYAYPEGEAPEPPPPPPPPEEQPEDEPAEDEDEEEPQETFAVAASHPNGSRASALDLYLDRQERVVLERLRGPKARKGTVLWDPPGDAQVDGRSLVDLDRWDTDLVENVGPEALGINEAILRAVHDAVQVGDDEGVDDAVRRVRSAYALFRQVGFLGSAMRGARVGA